MPYAASPSPKRHMPTDDSPMLSSRSRKKASAASLPPPSVPHLAVDNYEKWMDGLDVNKPIPRLYPLQRSDTLRMDTESSRRRVEEGLLPTSGGVHAGSSSLLKGGGGGIHSSSVSSSALGDFASRSQPFGGGDGTSNIFSSPSPHRPSGGGSGSPSSHFRRGFASQGGYSPHPSSPTAGSPSPPSTLRRTGSIRITAPASGTLLEALSVTAAINSDKRSLKSLIKTNKDIRHYLMFLLSIGSSDPRDDLAPVELNLESKVNITQLFGALDRNGDGVIFYDDLQVAVPILGLEYFSEVQYRRLLIEGHVIASGGGGGVVSKGNASTRKHPNTKTSQPGDDDVDANNGTGQHRSPRNNNVTSGGGGLQRGSSVRFQEPNLGHSASVLNQSFLNNGIGIRNFYKILFPQYSLIRIVTILKDMEHPTEKKKTARQLLAPEHIAEIEHLFNFFISQETERNRLKALDAPTSSPRRQQQMKPTIAEPVFIAPVPDKSPQPLKRRQSALSLQRRGSAVNLMGSGSIGGTTPAAAPLSRFKAAVGKLSQSVRGGSTTAAIANIPTISIEEIVAPVIEPHTTTLLTTTTTGGGGGNRGEGGMGDTTSTSPPKQQQTQTIAEELRDRAIEHYEQHDIDGDGRLTLDQYIDAMKHNYPPFKATELHRASLFDLCVSRIPPPNGATNNPNSVLSHAASSDPLAKKSSSTSPAAHHHHQPSQGGMRGTTASVFKLDNGVAWVDSVVGKGMELVEANHARIVTMYSPRNMVGKFDHLSSPADFIGAGGGGGAGSQSPSPKVTSSTPLSPPHLPPPLRTTNLVPSPPSHRGGSKGARGGTSEADALRPQSFLRAPPPEELSIEELLEGQHQQQQQPPSSSSSPYSPPSTTPNQRGGNGGGAIIVNPTPSPQRGGAIELRPIAPYVMLSPQKYGSKMLQSVKSGAIQREWLSNNEVTLNAEQILQEPRSFGEGRVPALMSKYEKSPSS